MPPTPTRSTPRGGRQRQSSSLHPQTGPSAPYASTSRGQRGVEIAATPFVHPALAQAAGAIGDEMTTTMSAASAAQSRGRRPFSHKNLFARDLRNLMYAYGDSPNPLPDSVSLMEEMMVDFITDLCCRARPSPYTLGLGTSSLSNSSSAFGATLEQQLEGNNFEAASHSLPPRAPHRLRVKLEDFRHALRKDVEAKKLGRMEQLLYADKVVTEARRVGGVEEAAERAGALQTEALPPPATTTSGSLTLPAGAAVTRVDGSAQQPSDGDSDDDMNSAPPAAAPKAAKIKNKPGPKPGSKTGPKKSLTKTLSQSQAH